ncbi:MAG: histidine phosphatase family protein [Thiobacillus sp.]
MHPIPRQARTRICIIRHGETDWNVEKRIQGHTDVPLNETGRVQALAMAFNAAHQWLSQAISPCWRGKGGRVCLGHAASATFQQ